MVLALPSAQPLRLGASVKEIVHLLEADTALQAANEEFLSASNKTASSQDFHVCPVFVQVCQGEEACVSYDSQDVLIGSDAATSCLLVLARCKATRRAWLAHFDNAAARLDPNELVEPLSHLTDIELYLVGSMQEPNGSSLQVLSAVLRALHEITDKLLHVKLACIWRANTHPDTGAPRTHGLWMQLNKGVPCPGAFPGPRGPNLPRRMSYASCCLASGWGYSPIVPICRFDRPCQIQLPPVPISGSNGLKRQLQALLALSDALLLSRCSTTPDYEPPTFIPEFRASMQWQLEMAKSVPESESLTLPAETYRWSVGKGKDMDFTGSWELSEATELVAQ